MKDLIAPERKKMDRNSIMKLRKSFGKNKNFVELRFGKKYKNDVSIRYYKHFSQSLFAKPF